MAGDNLPALALAHRPGQGFSMKIDLVGHAKRPDLNLGQLRKPEVYSMDHVASGSWETPVCFVAAVKETGRYEDEDIKLGSFDLMFGSSQARLHTQDSA